MTSLHSIPSESSHDDEKELSPSSSICNETDVISASVPRGGARRKVLPPIPTTTTVKSKTVADPLDSVLPLTNSNGSRNAMNTMYKGNLPALMPNSPITQQQSPTLFSQLSPVLQSSSCHNMPRTHNSGIDIDGWDPFNQEMASTSFTSGHSPCSTDRNQGTFSDNIALTQEPPASPLPMQTKSSLNASSHVDELHHRNTQRLPSPKGAIKSSSSRSNNKSSERSRFIAKSTQQSLNEKKFDENKAINTMSFKQFRNEVQKWRKPSSSNTKMTQKMQEFYRATFDSFTSISSTFKKRSENPKLQIQQNRSQSASQLNDPLIEQKFVGMMYELLLEMPQETQKTVLKGIINCLLNEWRGAKSENELRAYFILLQNPLFSRASTYVIYAHLLRQIATLHEKEQTLITQWLRRLSTPRFRPIVERIHQFITLRLFPDKNCKQQELPPMTKCPWWIPSAMKVMTLLYNANNLIKPRLISYREFYNVSLDHIDVMAEFKQWQSPASHPGFTFCQYPYVLSLCAKRHILRRDQERQMVRTARDELVTSVRRRPTRPPDVNQLFLNIKIRRQHLLQDSLSQIYGNRRHLKKKLRVEFIGEPGYDMGGLTKEWFLLLLRQVLSPDYGTFVHNDRTRTYWFATSENENFSDYFLVGVLMGLAVYNCITFDLRFPLVLYRKLLTPSTTNKPSSVATPIGLVSVSLDDLADIDPDLAHGFEELLKYEGNVEEDFGTFFTASKEEFGIDRTHILKPAGDKLPVTNANRREYIQHYLNWLINKSVYRQFSAFYEGFHTVCDSSALSLLCAEEVETLACGNPVFDLRDLKKYTSYEGFAANDPTILHFWDVTLNMQRDMQKKLLHFCTGSDRVPVGGMQDLKFKIIRAPTAQNMLPMAHTCFNQLLLPPYGSRSQLEQKLTIAVSNAEGFGLE
uniref:probable E3 ubiquitin-protein ligase HECTD2 n=1 Tax=Styela clava TaxID=7725 RepID=UPI001939FC06|nr:probable E3 ubiquitin-protein ligase HECTD2 [Styela clava]